MSMPIQRQSEAFGIFDDGPRFARDRSPAELPRGLAGLVNSTGPRISAGLLNTRQAAAPRYQGDPDEAMRRTSRIYRAGAECEYCGKPGHDWAVHPEAHRDVAEWERERRLEEFPFGDYTEPEYPADDDHDGSYWPGRNARLAVNTDGMDPASHAYGRQSHDPLFGEFGHDGYDYEGVSRSEYRNRTRDYDAEAASQEAREREDDESGYNWGPEPSGVPESLIMNRDARRRPLPRGRRPFDRAAARRLNLPMRLLAGDGMSWEDTMRYIDETLAEGEPGDRSDYSTDYYVDGPGDADLDDWTDRDWEQTPDYEPEQWHKVQNGRHVLVEKYDNPYEGNPTPTGWLWQHFKGNPFGSDLYPTASGVVPTRDHALAAGNEALAHATDDGHWADMRHHGHDPMDQGDPLTYRGQPEFANRNHPNYPEYLRRLSPEDRDWVNSVNSQGPP